MKIWIPVFIRNAIIHRAQKTPYFDLPGYMNRWWFARWGKTYPTADGNLAYERAMRVHHILRSDERGEVHNHPWNYITVILFGGYWEHRPIFNPEDDTEVIGYTRTWYGPGSVLFRKANSFHFLELEKGKTAWTLFCTGKYRNGWGFLVETPNQAERTMFVPWRVYLAERTMFVPWRVYLGTPPAPDEQVEAEKLFTREQATRIAELAVYEAQGELLGCAQIAEKVVSHYDDEDGKMRSFVSDEKSEVNMDEIDLS